MFDIGWSELVVIAVVALVVIGPKELPATLRTIGKMTARARKVAGDFRAQFDEAMREADLNDVRQTIADAQKLNPVNSLREAMNPLREMGNEIKADLQRSTTQDKPAVAATPLPAEPVPGVSAGLPEALSATAAPSNPSPAAAAATQSVPVVSETVAKPKKPRAKTTAKADEVAAAAVKTPVVTEKPKRAPRKVATAAVAKTAAAPRKRATASKTTPKKKDDA
ncbi:Sec-independent protein translocase protein TatB [Rhizobium lusitanum]|uniref:Sec-independent protein translocase protein TatB n=1 Tax=Rhizobium lusitanum TaxID=293958 RepID=A0A7X0IMB0_9HYPH|nr:Sec-independent protein translocase protein TatB [Rhizobium lusitanum]MBB6483630.1 sec-independent protein translocase protein TatB [Rhizobium lusitanum]